MEATKNPDNFDEIAAKATRLRDQGHGLEAVKLYLQASEHFNAIGDFENAARNQHGAGIAWKIENNQDEAIAAFARAIELYKLANDQFGPGRVQRDIAVTFYNNSEHAKALEAIESSISSLSSALEAQPGEYANGELGISFAKRAMISTKLDQLDDAIADLGKALELTRKSDNWFYEMTTLMHCSMLARAQGDWSQATSLIHAAIGMVYENAADEVQTRRLAECHYGLAHCYINAHNIERAHGHYLRARLFIAGMTKEAQKLVKDTLNTKVLEEMFEK